jgi:hypothetical protein
MKAFVILPAIMDIVQQESVATRRSQNLRPQFHPSCLKPVQEVQEWETWAGFVASVVAMAIAPSSRVLVTTRVLWVLYLPTRAMTLGCLSLAWIQLFMVICAGWHFSMVITLQMSVAMLHQRLGPQRYASRGQAQIMSLAFAPSAATSDSALHRVPV